MTKKVIVVGGASGQMLSREQIADLTMNPEYKRCDTCDVPMHVDGHEKCIERDCPCYSPA